jgi:hypothetical protein
MAKTMMLLAASVKGALRILACSGTPSPDGWCLQVNLRRSSRRQVGERVSESSHAAQPSILRLLANGLTVGR